MTQLLRVASTAFAAAFWFRALVGSDTGMLATIAVVFSALAAATWRPTRPTWILASWVVTPAILVLSPSGGEITFALSAPQQMWQIHAVVALLTAGIAAAAAALEIVRPGAADRASTAHAPTPSAVGPAVAVVLGVLVTAALPVAARPDVPAPAPDGPDLVVELVDNSFEPNLITLPAGARVQVRLDNTGALPHTFSIDELDLDVRVPAGRWTLVEFDVPADDVAVYCSVGDHRAQGMQAVLRVTS